MGVGKCRPKRGRGEGKGVMGKVSIVLHGKQPEQSRLDGMGPENSEKKI
jgi:hypothetical protein